MLKDLLYRVYIKNENNLNLDTVKISIDINPSTIYRRKIMALRGLD